MPLLVMFAIVQVVFTGVLFKIFNSPGVEQVAWLMPSRWAVGATGATVDLGTRHGALGPREAGRARPAVGALRRQIWALDMSVLVLMAVVCGFVVARLLRRHEPEVMRK